MRMQRAGSFVLATLLAAPLAGCTELIAAMDAAGRTGYNDGKKLGGVFSPRDGGHGWGELGRIFGAMTGLARYAAGERLGNLTDADVAAATKDARRQGVDEAKVALVRIKRASLTPSDARPGEDITLEMDYALTGPGGARSGAVVVVETFEIYAGRQRLAAQAQPPADRTPGVWRARTKVTLPETMPDGSYEIRYLVETKQAAGTMAADDRRDLTVQSAVASADRVSARR